MTLLAGLSIGATGMLVVFGAVTGRLASMIAALVKPSDLATSGGYVGGVSNTGINAATTPDQNQNLLTVLVKEVRIYGAESDPSWPQVEALVAKANNTKKQSDYDAAIAALRALVLPYKSKATAGRTP